VSCVKRAVKLSELEGPGFPVKFSVLEEPGFPVKFSMLEGPGFPVKFSELEGPGFPVNFSCSSVKRPVFRSYFLNYKASIFRPGFLCKKAGDILVRREA
jgi:hypothetical protein